MRTISSLVLVAVIQLVAYTECFKFDRGHGVPDLILPSRLVRQKEHYYQPLGEAEEDDAATAANNHLLYISNNRQRPINGLYQDHLESNSNYRKTLDAIAAEAALAASTSSLDDVIIDEDDLNQDAYSEELHLDDFIPNDDEDEPGQLQEAEETASHSSLMAGHQYVSGGAGEGKQHLHPDGTVNNKEEIKSDEDLPAYCDPPNPCPLGYLGDDCDARPYHEFSAEYSKAYQEQQNCMCDDDHNDCQKSSKSKSLDNKMNDMMMGNLQQMTHVEVTYNFNIHSNIRISSCSFYRRNTRLLWPKSRPESEETQPHRLMRHLTRSRTFDENSIKDRRSENT